MGKSLCPDLTRASIALLSALIMLLLSGVWLQVAVMVLAAVVGRAVLPKPQPLPAPTTSVNLRGTWMFFLLFLILLLALPLLVSVYDNEWLQLFDSFYRAGALVFGGGHVGRAIVNTLAPLPFAVRWIDSRDEIFPDDVPVDVDCEHSNPVQAAVADLAPGSRVLIMSFSHAEDLDIVVACLKRLRAQDDLPFVGLIGSATKWATFRHRLEDRGFTAEEIARITCPIGVPGITGKEPEVIAVAVAAQLLQTL